MCTVLALAACGGGGGGSDPAPAPVPEAPVDTGVPAAATAALQSSQAAAEALARDAELRTRDVRLASGLSAGIDATPGASAVAPDALLRRRALALQDYTAELCSSGSATLDIADALLARFNADPNAALVAGDSIGVRTRLCVVKAGIDLGDVALGDFGTGASVDGSFVLTLQTRSGSDIVFALVYDDFSYTPFGGSAYPALDANLRFGTVAGQDVYTLDIPGTRFLVAPAVVSSGDTVAVSSAALRGRVPAAAGSGYADYVWRDWSYDAAAQRAGSGTVFVQGAAATSATIVAGAGGYTVDIASAGSVARYAVAR